MHDNLIIISCMATKVGVPPVVDHSGFAKGQSYNLNMHCDS